MDDQMPLIVY